MECKNFHDTEDRLDVSKRAGGLREPRGKYAGKYNTKDKWDLKEQLKGSIRDFST